MRLLEAAKWEPPVKEVTTVGIDIAKSAFQVRGKIAASDVIARRKLRSSEAVELSKHCRPAGWESTPVRPAPIGRQRLPIGVMRRS